MKMLERHTGKHAEFEDPMSAGTAGAPLYAFPD